MQQAAQSLQSAQQSLQQAGQGTQMAQGQQSATDQEMGQEMGQSGQNGQQKPGGQQGQNGQSSSGSQSGSSQNGGKKGGKGPGMGGPGVGFGGSAGPQQPLPGPKHSVLVPGMKDPNGKQLTKVYMGTPDPTQDKAAYYTVVPEKTRAAEASLGREDIPAGYKNAVKTYFQSIQPGK